MQKAPDLLIKNPMLLFSSRERQLGIHALRIRAIRMIVTASAKNNNIEPYPHSTVGNAGLQSLATLSVVTATQGRTQKTILFRDGRAEKDTTSSLAISEGSVQQVTVSGLAGLKSVIEDIKPNQALTLGGVGSSQVLNLMTDIAFQAAGSPDGSVSRTKKFFGWSDSHFILLDHDPEPGQEGLGADEFLSKLVGVIPELALVGRLVTTSSSSGIYHRETCLKPETGHHTYLMVCGDINRLVELLKVRGWAKGRSFFKLANPNKITGVSSILERHLIDTAVFSPERLVYEAGARFEAGSPLEQRRTPPRLYDGAVLNCDLLPDPTPAERAAAKTARDAAYKEIGGVQLDTAIAVGGYTKLEAKRLIGLAAKGQLEPGHMLYTPDGGSLKVSEISAQHDGLVLRDPQEPTYRNGAAVARLYWNEGRGWVIYSQAHGGCSYTAALQYGSKEGRKADLEICRKSLEGFDFSKVPSHGILAIQAAKGTGKSRHFIKALLAGEKSALLIGHLINLTTANSKLMGFDYRADIDRGAGYFIGADGAPTYRLSTVIDSLLQFPARDFNDAVIVIDEVNQVLRSLLTSALIGKRGNRSAIENHLRDILRRARLVVVADADLSDWALGYLEALRGDGKKAFVVKNTYVPEGYPVKWHEHSISAGIVEESLDAYKCELAKGHKGQHIVIATDSGAKAKVLAEMARKLPGARVIEIHRDTSGEDFEKDFVKSPTRHLNEAEGPTILIYSPSMGTGVSIESQNIAQVFGIFEGASITDTDILQMLGRVRAPVPRVIWVRKHGSGYSKISRSCHPSEIKQALKNRTDALALEIKAGLSEPQYTELPSFTWDTDPHIEAYCQIEVERNRAMPALRERVAYRLENEGNRITERIEAESKGMAKALKMTKDELAMEEAIATVAAPECGETRAQLIANKANPTLEEKRELKKFHLGAFYLEQVTADLVLADREGAKRSEVKNLEELLTDELGAQRDVAALEGQLKWGADISPQDLRIGSVSVKVRKLLELDKWIFKDDPWLSDCDELADFKALCLRVKEDIKLALGYSVKEASSAQQILTALLRQFGIKVQHKRVRIEGEYKRSYWIEQGVRAELFSLIERRKVEREEVETLKRERVSLYAGMLERGSNFCATPPPFNTST